MYEKNIRRRDAQLVQPSLPAAQARRWSLVAGCVVILTIGSLLPSAGVSGGGWDAVITPSLLNLLHIPAYLLLAALVLHAGVSTESIRCGSVSIFVILCVLYGALLESLQAGFIPGRTGSVADCLLNALGVVIGVSSWFFFPPSGVDICAKIERSD
ncbi:MAG TPA: hypothetical protein EYN91_19885 [Candidatus Melainabacteria bacterium]|nr:hypothetical protein [Candidatus Melainabacteria bacterium]